MLYYKKLYFLHFLYKCKKIENYEDCRMYLHIVYLLLNTMQIAPIKNSKDEFEIYLKSGLTSAQVVSLLKAQNKDSKDIDAFMEKYEIAKKRMDKLACKIIQEIKNKYGQLDEQALMLKVEKFATKCGISKEEKEAFICSVREYHGDIKPSPWYENIFDGVDISPLILMLLSKS